MTEDWTEYYLTTYYNQGFRSLLLLDYSKREDWTGGALTESLI